MQAVRFQEAKFIVVLAAFAIAATPCLAAKPQPSSGGPGFIENLGQWDTQAKYLAQFEGLNLWLTDDGLVFDVHRDSGSSHGSMLTSRVGHVFKIAFAQNGPGDLTGVAKRITAWNFLEGRNRASWFKSIPAYSEVHAHSEVAGAEIRYYFDRGLPRYDIRLAPGTNPAAIAMQVTGADGVRVLPDGNLRIETAIGLIEERGLVAYQGDGAAKVRVPCRMLCQGDTIRFSVEGYDHKKPLVIDPLIFGTYLGGTAWDRINAEALDASGNVVVAGQTASANFPTTLGSYSQTFNGGNPTNGTDAFVAKLTPDGKSLLFGTYLGGSGNDEARGVAVDATGNIIVIGSTASANFPTSANAYQSKAANIFISKLSGDGSTLLFSTYLGGSSGDVANALTVDSNGNAVVAGTTYSADFPTSTAAFQTSNSNFGLGVAFVSRISADGTTLLSSTLLSGSAGSVARALALDSAGDAVVAGQTASTDFPLSTGAYQSSNNSFYGDAFVSRVSADGTSLISSTLFGGSGADAANGVAVDSAGNSVIVGDTNSPDLPTTPGAFQRNYAANGNTNAFVARISADATSLLESTYFGAAGNDVAKAVGLDSQGDIVIGGTTYSQAGFPVTPLACQIVNNSSRYGNNFIAELSPDCSSVLYCTFLGGALGDICSALLVDPSDDAVLCGYTFSSNAPVTAGAYQTKNLTVLNGGYTGYIAKVSTLPCFGLTLSANQVLGGYSVTGMITSHVPAPPSGVVFAVSSPSGNLIVPASATMAGGTASVSFTIQTPQVTAEGVGSVAVTYGNVTRTVSLTIDAYAFNISLTSSSPVGGSSITGTIVAKDVAPTGGLVLNLTSSDPSVSVPSSVTVAAGNIEASFPIQTAFVSAPTAVSISASYQGITVNQSLTVEPYVFYISTRSSNVQGGNVLNAYLSGPAAPAGGVTLALSSNSAALTVPGTATIPAGAVGTSFPMQSSVVGANTPVAISASFEGLTQTVDVTVSPYVYTLSLKNPTIVGGYTVSGSVSGPACPGGSVTLSLAADNAAASVPASITIPAAGGTVGFNVQTTSVAAATAVNISSTLAGTSKSVTLTVNPYVFSLALSAGTAVGGNAVQATISGTAVSSDVAFTLASDNSAATVPTSATIPAAGKTVAFSIQTSAVGASATANISASYQGVSQTQALTITPYSFNLALGSASALGGYSVTGTISGASAAPAGGVTFTLASDNSAATMSGSASIAAGASSASFAIQTSAVSTATVATISASLLGTSSTQTLTVNPYTFQLSLAAASIVGGDSVSASVSGPSAPPGGVSIALASSDPAVAIPASVTISAGTTSAAFRVQTSTVSATAQVTITASYMGSSSTQSLAINPYSFALSLSSNVVLGGNALTGTVTGPAAPGAGVIFSVASNSPCTSVPTVITIGSGSTSASFPIQTSVTGASATASITVSLQATSAVQTLTINPYTFSLSLSENFVLGGNAVQASVTGISAPSSGVSISLSSDNPAAAVPSSITIAPGALGGTFTIQTSPVGAATSATVSATLQGVSSAQTLAIQPYAFSLKLSALATTGGEPLQGMITGMPAPLTGVSFALAADNSAVSVPPTVQIAPGQSSVAFAVTTGFVSASTIVHVSASLAGGTTTQVLTLSPYVFYFSTRATSVVSGGIVGANLSGRPAPPGGVAVSLSADNSAISLPTSVTIPEDQIGTAFLIQANSVAAATVVHVSATFMGETLTIPLTVEPYSFVVYTTPSAVVGGNGASGTVLAGNFAPAGGVSVSLSSDNTSAAVPASVTIPAGSAKVGFPIETQGVSTTTACTITATAGSYTSSCMLTIKPAILASVSVSNSSVTGGSSETVTVALNGTAPPGGATVTLKTNCPQLVVLPPNITIPAGATQASVTVTANTPSANTTVSLAAIYAGIARRALFAIAP